MGNRTLEREEVEILPPEALTVKKFAEKNGYSHNHVYVMSTSGKLAEKGFKIVKFQGFNFVVPL